MRTFTSTQLFSTDLDPLGLPITGRNQYQVDADGQRFLMNQPRGDGVPTPVTVLVNWPEAVKRSIATSSHLLDNRMFSRRSVRLAAIDRPEQLLLVGVALMIVGFLTSVLLLAFRLTHRSARDEKACGL